MVSLQSHAHGTKGYASYLDLVVTVHKPAFTQDKAPDSDLSWMFGRREGGRRITESNPYQDEWDHLLEAIRNDKEYNECERGVQASVVTSMGRMACHTGQIVTYDQMLNADHFGPGADMLSMDSDSPQLPT